jgi:cell division septum initiation protein DivIVA
MTLKEWLKSLYPDKTAEIDLLSDGTEKPPQPAPVQSQGIDISALVHNRSALETLVQAQEKQAQQIAQLTAQLAEKDKAVTAYEAERAATQAAIERQQQETRKAEIAKIIADAQADGRIEAKNEEKANLYRSLLEANFETGKLVVDGLPKSAAYKPEQKPTESTKTTTSQGVAGVTPIEQARESSLSEIRAALQFN